ncbi:MAG: DUF2461 family protein [candidate division Zixibacteria bacterium]|nr:DUF2461 family protein [candidate division Zixibacteria bacterium]
MPITKETFQFMADLWDNNNKNWFNQNRERYVEHVREPMKELADSLIAPVSAFLPDFNGKPKISRINADIRFNPKKKPYKEHVWISFYEEGQPISELFVYIGRNGWGAGVGAGARKREELDTWRENLLTHTDHWRNYAKAIGLGKNIMAHTGDPYKKPLYDDIPEDVYEEVQAKNIWIVDNGIRRKQKPAADDFFERLCIFLPTYFFQTLPGKKLLTRLKDLGTTPKAPTPKVEKVWKAVK